MNVQRKRLTAAFLAECSQLLHIILPTLLDHADDFIRPVIASDHLLLTSPGNDLHQRPDHALVWQLGVHLDTQLLPIEIVDDVELQEVAPVVQGCHE